MIHRAHLFALTALVTCSCWSGAGLAQSADSMYRQDQSQWVQSLRDRLLLKADFNSRTQAFTVQNSGFSPDIRPNVAAQTDLSINYRFLAFRFGYAADWLPGNGDDAEKGASRVRGVGVALLLPHWFHDFGYQRTRGYYLANTGEIDPAWKAGDPYRQFPDLVVTSLEGTSGYSFNPRFSVRALTLQTERQLKSAGSFIPRAVYRFYVVDNQTPLLTPTSTSQRSDNLELMVGAAYHYTFVWRESFFATAGVQAGVGYVFSKIVTRDQTGGVSTRQQNPVGRFDARLGCGYNGSRFFAGVIAQGDWTQFNQTGGIAVTREYRTIYHVFAGYRFGAPAGIRKLFDRLEEKGRTITSGRD